MVDELISGLRFAWDGAQSIQSSDQKRSRVAKKLLQLHRDINAVVARGHEIVDALQAGTDANALTPLLIEQLMAMGDIGRALSRKPLVSIVAVQVPTVEQMSRWAFEIKSSGISDLLANINRVGGALEADLASRTVLGLGAPHPHGGRMSLDTKELERARAVLTDLASASEQLRVLLLEKFQVQDVL